MASQTQGIQQLLAAEKRAAEKVSEARKRKWKNIDILLRWTFVEFYLATLSQNIVYCVLFVAYTCFTFFNIDYTPSSKYYVHNLIKKPTLNRIHLGHMIREYMTVVRV